MMHHDEFFTPEDVDRQIDQASQPSESDRADVEMLAYLRSYYQLEAPREQEMLARIWSRIEPALIEEPENGRQDRPARGGTLTGWPPQRPAGHSRRASFMQRLEVPAAVLLLAASHCRYGLLLHDARHRHWSFNSAAYTGSCTHRQSTKRLRCPIAWVNTARPHRQLSGDSPSGRHQSGR